MSRVFIGIGSNIDPDHKVTEAIRSLACTFRIVGISTVWRTKAIGKTPQPPFYNLVVEIETRMSPPQLKARVLRRIEDELGRRRSGDRYAPRTIDLDILLYGEHVVAADGLTIPAPDICARSFLAAGICELAPDLVLPGSKEPIRQIAQRLGQRGLEELPGFTRSLRELIRSAQPTGRGKLPPISGEDPREQV